MLRYLKGYFVYNYRWRRDIRPDRSWGPTQPPVQGVPCLFPGGGAGWGVALATHPRLVSTLSMGTSIPLLSLWTCMAGYRMNSNPGGMILILCDVGDSGVGCTNV